MASLRFVHALQALVLGPPLGVQLYTQPRRLKTVLGREGPLPYKVELISFNALLGINIHKVMLPPPRVHQPLKKKINEVVCILTL